MKKLVVWEGDITELDVDVIVNAANSGLRGGGGVDGAIHRAGGEQIMEECRRIGGCETGSAVRTGAGNLKAKWVVHAVGPVWRGGDREEKKLLQGCYFKSLELAEEVGAKTVAFPSISTGIYGYPVELAAESALEAVDQYFERASGVEKVIFVTFSTEDTAIWQRLIEQATD